MARPAGFTIRHWTDEEKRLVAETLARLSTRNVKSRARIYRDLAAKVNRTVKAIRSMWFEQLKPVE